MSKMMETGNVELASGSLLVACAPGAFQVAVGVGERGPTPGATLAEC